jgi:microcystin-dependent protein
VTSAEITVSDHATRIQTLNESILSSSGGDVLTMTGEVRMWSGATTPSGWMACNGSAISRSNYLDLFAILGTTYGAGDGSSTFNIPDMRGRVAVGTGSGAGLTNRALGQNGGKESQTGYTAPSMTSSGTLYASEKNSGVWDPVSIPRSWSVNSGNQGDTTIMQPFLVLEYIIKT